jgi:ribosomal peptide maturation radical SAM protein 1
MSHPAVVLVSMPWLSPSMPSIQLGILKAVLERRGVSAQCRSYHLAFMDYLTSLGFPFSPSENAQVGSEFFTVGLGDWIFAVPPFRSPRSDHDWAYLELLRRHGAPEPLIAKVLQLRALVPGFLDQCAADLVGTGAKIVGFSSTLSQCVASLCLAKLVKRHSPGTRIVMGGADCAGDMGAALFRSFDFLDAVVRGEGELVFPALVADWLAGRPVRPQTELCYRAAGKAVIGDANPAARVPMDDIPMPDYDEYFARLKQHRLRDQIGPEVAMPIETSRGCWWGEKSHCTFCGLNGATMRFRSKSADQVRDEILALAQRYRRHDFFAVDNILDLQYFKEFLPKLRATRLDLSFFYEVKANLSKAQLRLMRDAGVRRIQPGVESFSNVLLKLMRKGTTGLQNVRLLKWCTQLGINPEWNFLYGFPGEPAAEYERQVPLLESLVHLKPPRLVRVVVERFSPYHTSAVEHGIEILGPARHYELIYELPRSTLRDLAYCFEARFVDGHDAEQYVSPCRRVIDNWHRAWPASVGTLSYRRGPGFLTISDRRPGFPARDQTLDELESAMYLACDSGGTAARVAAQLQRTPLGRGVGVDRVAAVLDKLTEWRLMYREDDRYLSLALRANVNEIVSDLAGDSDTTESSPQPIAPAAPPPVLGLLAVLSDKGV